MKKAICVLICISLMIMPVLASESATQGFTKIKVSEADNAFQNRSGVAVLVDADDFLNLVTTAYGINQDFRSVFTNVPYSVCQVTIQTSGGQSFTGQSVLFRSGNYERRSGNNATFVGSYYIGNNNLVTFNTYFYSDALAYTTSHATYYLPKDAQGYLIMFDIATDPDMMQVLAELESINAICASMSSMFATNNTRLSTISSTLSSILTSVNTCKDSLSTIATRLSTIHTDLQNIYSRLNVINTSINTQTDVVAELFDELFDQLAIIDGDLQDIESQLTYFSNAFVIYADSVLNKLENIDENVQALYDDMHGEALKDYTVTPHGGGSSINLWQVIKMGVSGGMSAIGSFFNMLLESVGLFGGNSVTGFDILYDVNEATETYSPTNLLGGS